MTSPIMVYRLRTPTALNLVHQVRPANYAHNPLTKNEFYGLEVPLGYVSLRSSFPPVKSKISSLPFVLLRSQRRSSKALRKILAQCKSFTTHSTPSTSFTKFALRTWVHSFLVYRSSTNLESDSMPDFNVFRTISA